MDSSKRKELLETSKVFCMAPWVHMHMGPHGHVFPCCIAAHDEEGALGNVSEGEKLKQIWNSTNSKNLRKNMLEGRESSLCKLCYKYENIGDKSPRYDMNELFGEYLNLTDNTLEDGTYDDFTTIKFVDFRFSNLCNYKCRICSHHFSSKWYEDAKAIGWIQEHNDKGRLIAPVDDMEALWLQIEPILAGIEKIQFAGGEPLVMKEHYRILDYFIEHEMFTVNITYNTNFSTFKYKETNVLDRWKKLRHTSLAASLDGMGARGDYMRKGQDWDEVVRMRKQMMEECPHVRFQLTPTISIMNVLHFPDFYKDWVDKKLMGPTDFNIYMLFEPAHYNIQRLPAHLKAQVRRKYSDFKNSYISLLPDADVIKSQFQRVITHMDEEDLPMLPDFKKHTVILDQMRDESFVKVFPELAELMD